MGKNPDEIVVAQGGALSVAPVGTDLPSDLGPLADAYVDLGYLSEDGATVTKGRTVEEVPAWQSPVAVRRYVSEESLGIEGELLQWNRDSWGLAMGGGQWSEPNPGVFRYDPPTPSDALPEHVSVLDWQDGERQWRLVVEKSTVDEDVETEINRQGASVLPVTLGGVAAEEGGVVWYLLCNDEEAFGGSGS